MIFSEREKQNLTGVNHEQNTTVAYSKTRDKQWTYPLSRVKLQSWP